MLTVGDYLLFSKDLLEITNKFKRQTATELFHSYIGTATIVNQNYKFHFIATSSDDLRTLFIFFNKFRLTGNQTIRLKFMNINQDEFRHIVDEFRYTAVWSRLSIDVAYDKSGDFVDSYQLEQMGFIISNIKRTIPKDASNLEIMLYIYNWLKKREYRHSEDDPYLSKRYSSALLSDFIVCVGFTKIFNNILAEYGIRASEYMYYFENNGEEVGHDISIVNVKDEKYGIEGLYFFDLTRDCYDQINDNDNNYSGFMMTYDKVAKDNIVDDMFNKMLLLDNQDIQDTIDLFKPEMDLIDWDNDEIETDCGVISRPIEYLVQYISQVDADLFTKNEAIDFYYLSNNDLNLFYIYSYILFLKNKLGKKVDDNTFTDLLINTIKDKTEGYYLLSVKNYNSENYGSTSLEEQHQYIKMKLENNE